MRTIAPIIVLLLLPSQMTSHTIGQANGEAAPLDLPPEQEGDPTIICFGTGQRGRITSLGFAPDGKTLAAGDIEGVVTYYDPGTGSRRSSFRALDLAKSHVQDLAFSPDGRTLATPCEEGGLGLFDAATGRLRLKMSMPPVSAPSFLTAVAYSPDGKVVAAGAGPGAGPNSADGEVSLWDAASGRHHLTLPAHVIPARTIGPFNKVINATPASITALAFSPDGSLLFGLAGGALVRIWDVQTGEEPPRSIVTENPRSMALSADGKILAVGGQHGEYSTTLRYAISLWDVASKRKLGQLAMRHQNIGLAFLPAGHTLVSLDEAQVVRLWDADRLQSVSAIRFDHRYPPERLAVSPDGRLIAVGGGCGIGGLGFGFIQLIDTDGTTLKLRKAKQP